eukprot:g797.t1
MLLVLIGAALLPRLRAGPVDSFGASTPNASTSGCFTNKQACAPLTFEPSIWGNQLLKPYELCGVDASSSAVTITTDATTRTISSNGCPGYDWRKARSGKDALVTRAGSPAVTRLMTFSLPRQPQMNDLPLDVRKFHGPIGITLNGVLFYGPSDAAGRDKVRQLGAKLDPCGGTALENGQYHYMSTPGDKAPLSHYASRNNRFEYCDDLPRHMRSTPGLHSPLLGFMVDGVPIYGPQDVGGVPPADLDECQGHTDAEHPFYHYHTTSNFPYLVGCLRGCISADMHKRIMTNTVALEVPATPKYVHVARNVDCAEQPIFQIGPGWELALGRAACEAKCNEVEDCDFYIFQDDYSCRTYLHCREFDRISTGAKHSDLYFKVPTYHVVCKPDVKQYDYSSLVAYTAATWSPPNKCLGSSTALPAAECAAWQEMFDSMGGSDWGVCKREIERSDPCFCSSSSQFVECEGGHITKLHLPTNRLQGTIPSSIAALTRLESLVLAGNMISGSIPAAIFLQLTALVRLGLGSNKLVGSIPPLSALTKLTSLNFAANNLGDFCKPVSKTCGVIPELKKLTMLNSLSLGMNLLTGTVPDISTLTALSSLNLGSNPSLRT